MSSTNGSDAQKTSFQLSSQSSNLSLSVHPAPVFSGGDVPNTDVEQRPPKVPRSGEASPRQTIGQTVGAQRGGVIDANQYQVHPVAWPLPVPVLDTNQFNANSMEVHPAAVTAMRDPTGSLRATVDLPLPNAPNSLSPGSFQMVPTPSAVMSMDTSPDTTQPQAGVLDHLNPEDLLNELLREQAQGGTSVQGSPHKGEHYLMSPRVSNTIQKLTGSPPRGRVLRNSRSSSATSKVSANSGNSTTLKKENAGLKAELSRMTQRSLESHNQANMNEQAWVGERAAHHDNVEACLRQGQAIANYAAHELGNANQTAMALQQQAERIQKEAQDQYHYFAQCSQAANQELARTASEEMKTKAKCENELVAY